MTSKTKDLANSARDKPSAENVSPLLNLRMLLRPDNDLAEMSYLDKSDVIHEVNSPDYEDADSAFEDQSKFWNNLSRPQEMFDTTQTAHF